MVIDIIDPHNPDLGDAADKLKGVAEYAEKHGSQFRRIESIIVDEDEIRLNLQDAEIRAKAKTVKTSVDVQRLFDEFAVTPPTA